MIRLQLRLSGGEGVLLPCQILIPFAHELSTFRPAETSVLSGLEYLFSIVV